MPVTSIPLGANITASRGSIVVCIPAGNESVAARTPADVPVVLYGEGDAVVALTAPADVVLVSGDCAVAAGWLDALRAAAYSDSNVATASALVIPAPQGRSFEDAAAAVLERSLGLRPRLATADGRCVYIRRSAVELVADDDPISDLVGFCERCRYRGLSHVLADDVTVCDPHDTSWPAVSEHAEPPLARSLSRVRRTLCGMSVVIDARILSRPMTGTERQVLEVIAALGRAGTVRLTAILPDRVSADADAALRRVTGVTWLRHGDAGAAILKGRADVVHRPHQVRDPSDLTFLASLGERLVLTNQDLISYYNPWYFEGAEEWLGYRRMTRLALGIADRAVFVSTHARDEALAEDLVSAGRASVVLNGVDHPLTDAPLQPVAPLRAAALPADAETILCIGTDYPHKNRMFALRMLEQLVERDRWNGCLLFAGPTVAGGSAVLEEAAFVAGRPALRKRVIDFGAVSEAEKAWLLRRVALVLYPTVHEGFGLVPFEAARYGVPSLWAAGTALNEVLPDGVGGIVPWDAALSAERALELLRDDDARAHQLAGVRSAAEKLTWDRAAAGLLEVYEAACDAPAVPAAVLERSHGLLAGTFSEDAMRLIGPGGALAPELHRPLLALVTHRALSAPLFGALKLAYRAGAWLRHARHSRR